MRVRGGFSCSSQPTYEELKPKPLCHQLHVVNRSQPTYEELKHKLLDAADMAVSGSQPTYEELKPGAAIPTGTTRRVPSLPMRN